MITNPEQFAQIQKSALEAFQNATAASIAGFEKLAALNVQATKTSFEESAETLRTLVEVKDPKQWADLATTSVQPTTDKVAAYYKHVYEIANETGSELARLFERQYAENKQAVEVAEANMAAAAKTTSNAAAGAATRAAQPQRKTA